MRDPVKIHPVIASDVTSDEPTEIPICSKLACCGKNCQAIPTPGGTLADLRPLLERLFAKEKQNSNGTIVFELDFATEKYVRRTLDQLLRDYDYLTKYDKIVICCPVHYLASEARHKEGLKITKLIYRFRRDELPAYPELEELYHNHLDSYKQDKRQFYFYEDVHSAAWQWVDRAKKVLLKIIAEDTDQGFTY